MLISLKFPAGVCSLDCVTRIQRVAVLPRTLLTLARILPPRGQSQTRPEACPCPGGPLACPLPNHNSSPRRLPAWHCQPRRSRSESGGIGRFQAAGGEKGRGWVPRSGSRKVSVERGPLAPSLVPPSIPEVRTSHLTPSLCPAALPSLERGFSCRKWAPVGLGLVSPTHWGGLSRFHRVNSLMLQQKVFKLDLRKNFQTWLRDWQEFKKR